MKQNNNAVRASALQVTLALALLFSLAIVFASNFKAASTAVSDRAQPTVVAQPGFYPALPNGPAPTCSPIEIDDKIATGDPKEMGRITPGGVPSSCGAPNPCNVTPGMFHFREYPFTNNTGGERCVTVELSSQCTGVNAIFAAAYADSFDPANICTNLIGDSGNVTTGSNLLFSFNVPSGGNFVVVVNETTENAGCQAFKLDVFICEPTPSPTPTATATSTPKPTPTPTPTPTPSPTPPKVSQITPTNTTCDQFLNGTATTLSFAEYSLKGNPAVINQVDPGVFFYWVKFTAVAGSNTVMVNETITSGNFSALFTYQAGSNVFNLDCETQHPTITQLGGTVSLTFNAPSAGVYVALVKFSANSVKGNAAPAPGTTVNYEISTAGVVGSTEGIDLKKKVNSL